MACTSQNDVTYSTPYMQDRGKSANLPQEIIRLVGEELVREFKLTNGSSLTAARSQVQLHRFVYYSFVHVGLITAHSSIIICAITAIYSMLVLSMTDTQSPVEWEEHDWSAFCNAAVQSCAVAFGYSSVSRWHTYSIHIGATTFVFFCPIHAASWHTKAVLDSIPLRKHSLFITCQ